MMKNIFKTYKSEWESLSFEDSTKQQVVGFLYVESLTGETNEKYEYGTVVYDDTQTQTLPLYEGFVNTRKLLEEAGCTVYTAKDLDKIEKIVLVSADNYGKRRKYTFSDRKDIKRNSGKFSF